MKIAALAVVVSAVFCYAPRATAQGADAVVDLQPGSGQSSGQSPEFFPANVLGLPDTSARRDIASVDPRQIASIGMGGVIVLRFDRSFLVDAQGPDFTVFENAFAYTIGGRERIYAEPAEVSVSRDGVFWVSFPYDPRTLVGCAGVTPTNGDRNPLDPEVSGGDAFDLATVGIDSARFVRIRDVTAMVANDPTHPFWDPTLSGFDLDAVVAIPPEARRISHVSESFADGCPTIHPNPANERIIIGRVAARGRVDVSDALGTVRLRATGEGNVREMDIRSLAPGWYSVRVETEEGMRTLPLRVVR